MSRATSIQEVREHMLHNGKSVAIFKTGRREYVRSVFGSVFGSGFFWAEDDQMYSYPSKLIEYIEMLPIVKEEDA